jgi:hypothetical protein
LQIAVWLITLNQHAEPVLVGRRRFILEMEAIDVLDCKERSEFMWGVERR